MEDLHLRVQGCIRFGISLLEPHADRGHLSTCLLEGSAGTETRDYARVIKDPVRRKIAGRDEDIDFTVRKEEPTRHDADYIAGHAAYRKGTANDARVGRELFPPAVVAQHGNMIFTVKAAAEQWSDTEHVEQVAAHDEAFQNARFADSGEMEVDPGFASFIDAHVSGHAGEDRAHALPVGKIRGRNIGTLGGFQTVNLRDRDKPTGLGIRQRPPQDRLCHCKHGCTCADTERQSCDRDYSEHAAFAERSSAEAEVIKERL